jgi:cathepsin L
MFEDIKANSGGYLNSVIPTVFSIDYSSSDNLCITNVKNQGSCGSCWAFAGVAELESYFMKYHKLLLDLSEQQMVDCLPAVQPNNAGCNGGQLDSVGYYSVLYPIAQEKYYRYTAVQGTCNQSKISEGPTFGIKSYVYVYDCVSLTDALLTLKPIGICAAIDTKWQNYISGVIANCNDAIVGGHCVLLVGATSDGTNAVNTNYWKIKNSWGTTFGEAGFMRLYKDNTDLTNGFCGLCTSAIYSV